MKTSLKIFVLILLSVACSKKETSNVERSTAQVSCEKSPLIGKWKAKSDETYIEFKKDCSFVSNECDSSGTYRAANGRIDFDTLSVKAGSACLKGKSNAGLKVNETALTFSFTTGEEDYTKL
nr:hypothetical protein BHI3_24380 [Bacteriovorax sp. HI3]